MSNETKQSNTALSTVSSIDAGQISVSYPGLIALLEHYQTERDALEAEIENIALCLEEVADEAEYKDSDRDGWSETHQELDRLNRKMHMRSCQRQTLDCYIKQIEDMISR